MKANGLLHAGELAGASVQYPAHPCHRILVVDEDSDLRLLYADVLALPGYHVDTAEDGAASWLALLLAGRRVVGYERLSGFIRETGPFPR